MSEWLKLLPLELSEMDEPDIIEPEHPLEKNDHLIGEMSDTTRRLFTLGRLLGKSAKQSALDAQYCANRTKKVELQARAREFAAKSNVLKELMWIGIQDEFGLWSANTGVRVGFKVVTTPEDMDNIPPFLRDLFNMG